VATVEVAEDPVPQSAAPNALAAALPGEITRIAGGDSFFHDTLHQIDQRHGLHTFRDLHAVSGSQLALLCHDPELAYVDLSRAVFLDTETTGLGMGAGTYVFLVGVGFLDGDVFRVRQYFLDSPGDEVSVLQELAAFLARFSVLVTFNGKAFDWPLLESRYVFRFRRSSLPDPSHIDLLHPARRLWKSRLESCALSSLEFHILRVSRTEQDVPGYMIPSLYFQYQRSGDGEALRRVFYHNLHDVLSVAALAVHMDRVAADPMSGTVEHALDFLCLGRLYERAGDSNRASACYDEALRRDLTPEAREDALIRLATLQKRQRWWDLALQTWDRLIDEGGDGALFALVELAKYYEHVERDYGQALDAVRQALSLAELRDLLGGRNALGELEHRLSRLLNREARVLGRSSQRFRSDQR
jgi:uncharacterized protein YprB with RNaseH-like and TPR domain